MYMYMYLVLIVMTLVFSRAMISKGGGVVGVGFIKMTFEIGRNILHMYYCIYVDSRPNY